MASPRTSQIDLMVSVDAVEVRNDLQGGPHPKAIENKKTEYVLSEILVPVPSSLSVPWFISSLVSSYVSHNFFFRLINKYY